MEADLFARFSIVGRGNFFPDLKDMLVFTPGDLKSAPLSGPRLVSGPNIQGDMLRDLRGAAHAYCQHVDQFLNIRPPSSARPILDAFTMAAELKGESAEESKLETHHLRDAHELSLDTGEASVGGPAERIKKFAQDARAPAAIREFMGSGRKLNVPRRADLSLACVSSRLRRWGVFCGLNVIPHFPPTELSVLRLSFFFPPGGALRMYPAHLAKGRQLNDCDASSWCTDGVKAAETGLSKTRDCFFADRLEGPTVSVGTDFLLSG